MHLNALECYTCICLGYGISHDVSDVAAQQVRPERSGDSRASEQGLSLPNKAVQRSLVRHNTAPLHRPPSPSARRRHTICNGSGMYPTLSYSHNCMHSHWRTHTDIHIRTHPHIPHMHENTHNTHIYTQCKICIIYILLHMVQFFSVNGSTTSRPNEPELRFHVAARLGLDWRKICTYLGLQHYQLQQADEAHTHLLEEKAMEALVMWLQGQGDSQAPRSWNTLLQALYRARRSDIASDVEMGIKNKTLAVGLSNYK